MITLSERRLRGDMIETFKTMRGINKLKREDWFTTQVEEQHRPMRSNSMVVGESVERRMEIIVGGKGELGVEEELFYGES